MCVYFIYGGSMIGIGWYVVYGGGWGGLYGCCIDVGWFFYNDFIFFWLKNMF